LRFGSVAARTAQGNAQVFSNIGQVKLPGVNTTFGDKNNVCPGRKHFPFQAKKFTDQAFDPVALDRVADFSPHGKADAWFGLFPRTCDCKAKQKKILRVIFPPLCIARKEFWTVFDPVLLPEG
jgi:hypothetical protein